jgi:hypothetical protein
MRVRSAHCGMRSRWGGISEDIRDRTRVDRYDAPISTIAPPNALQPTRRPRPACWFAFKLDSRRSRHVTSVACRSVMRARCQRTCGEGVTEVRLRTWPTELRALATIGDAVPFPPTSANVLRCRPNRGGCGEMIPSKLGLVVRLFRSGHARAHPSSSVQRDSPALVGGGCDT